MNTSSNGTKKKRAVQVPVEYSRPISDAWQKIHLKAEYIIAGDTDLTNLKSYQGIKIVKPAEFVRLLTR